MTKKSEGHTKVVHAKTVGERMKRYRMDRGLSISKLAEKLHDKYETDSPSKDVLTNIEYGRKSEVGWNVIVEIADALRVSPIALICDLEQPFLLADEPCFKGLRNSDVPGLFGSQQFDFRHSGPDLLGVSALFGWPQDNEWKNLDAAKTYPERIDFIATNYRIVRNVEESISSAVRELHEQSGFIESAGYHIAEMIRIGTNRITELKQYYEKFSDQGVVIPKKRHEIVSYFENIFKDYEDEMRSRGLLSDEDFAEDKRRLEETRRKIRESKFDDSADNEEEF